MNRDDLDAFFAKAEDVLTDWHGDTDAMHARVPTGDEPELPATADSYYEQAEPIPWLVPIYSSGPWEPLDRPLRSGESTITFDEIQGITADWASDPDAWQPSHMIFRPDGTRR